MVLSPSLNHRFPKPYIRHFSPKWCETQSRNKGARHLVRRLGSLACLGPGAHHSKAKANAPLTASNQIRLRPDEDVWLWAGLRWAGLP